MYQFKIGDKYTANDWGLLLANFEIGEAEPKTNYIDIPGGDGSIDLTEALTGEISYGNRTITATFTLIQSRAQWRPMMDAIRAHCHGRKFTILVPNDDEYYYIGRANIGALEINGSSASFEMTITCEPFKYRSELTVHNLTLGAGGTSTVTLINDRKRVVPTITVNNPTQVQKGAVSVSLSAGANVVTSLPMTQGENVLTFTAAAGTTIQVSYREGGL